MSMIQLPFNFDNSKDDRPLPLITADKWGFELAYVDQDGNADNYIYCARDWYMGLGGLKGNWSTQKSDWLYSLEPVEIEVKRPRRKPETVEFVDAKGLYLIASRMTPHKSKPELESIKKYLADAGVFADIARRNPIEAARQLHDFARQKGIVQRKEAMQGAKDSHITGRPQYGLLTNAEYEIVLGGIKSELVKVLGLDEKQAARFREELGTLAIDALQMVEHSIAIRFNASYGELTDLQQLEIVRDCAHIVAPAFHQMCAYLGVDVLRNAPLLS